MTAFEATLAEFRETVAGYAPEIPMVRSALLVARAEYPSVDIDAYERRIQDIATTLSQQLGRDQGGLGPKRAIDIANQLLFRELGFRGNSRHYDDPRNLYLNWVLDERKGIPVTLALVYSEVCQRAGLDVRPVGLPGHVICRYVPFTITTSSDDLLIDVFNNGRLLTEHECKQLVRHTFGGRVAFQQHHLASIAPRQVIQRLLHNLKAGYLQRGDEDRAVRISDLLLALYPWDLDERRDRGMLHERLGDLDAALRDLEQYVQYRPGADDAPAVTETVDSLRRHVAPRGDE